MTPFNNAPSYLNSRETCGINLGYNIFKQVVEEMPYPYYTCDHLGYINFYNKAVVKLWGREPVIGEDLWCGSYRSLDQKGNLLLMQNGTMATCIKEQRPVIGETIVVERPDGVKRIVESQAQPLFDEKDRFIGAGNILIDKTNYADLELKLSLKTRQIEEVLDTISDGFCEMDNN